MSWWWREKNDGQRAPGYFLYVLAGATAVVVLIFLHRRMEGAARPAGGRMVALPPTEVAAIVAPAALMTPVNVPGAGVAPSNRSYRLSPARDESPPAPAPVRADRFDPITAALGSPADGGADPLGGSVAGTPAPQSFAPLPPGWADEPGGGPHGSGAEPGKFFGYRDPAADPPAESGRLLLPTTRPARVPRGTLIAVYLLTTVDTSNPAAVLQFAVGRDVVFSGRRVLTFGTHLLGKLAGNPLRDRLNLAVDTILFPDGREVPISASAVEADDTGADLRPGVAAFYVPPPPWVEIAPYVGEVLTGLTGLLQSRAQQQYSVGVGGVSLQTTTPDAVKAPLLQASGQAIQDFTAARLKEVELRYASYYLIPAGTACWLQLDADLDLGPEPEPRTAKVRRGLPLSGVPPPGFTHDFLPP